jgi:hypothetical protein
MGPHRPSGPARSIRPGPVHPARPGPSGPARSIRSGPVHPVRPGPSGPVLPMVSPTSQAPAPGRGRLARPSRNRSESNRLPGARRSDSDLVPSTLSKLQVAVTQTAETAVTAVTAETAVTAVTAGAAAYQRQQLRQRPSGWSSVTAAAGSGPQWQQRLD